MARVFVTGSTDGLGLAAARTLIGNGHAVLLHARSVERTQSWLAVSDDPDARASGGYWHACERQEPAAEAVDPVFEDRLLERLHDLTGIELV